MADVPTAAPPPAPTAGPKAIVFLLVVAGVLGLIVSLALSMGIAAIFWVPTLFVAGGVMWSVWGARRRRQLMEHRDANELRDREHSQPRWPTKGVIDDRLPER